ncbi:unnamed protein product [Spirodela intermedia]|uniref:Uncharacterized protein n=1 Tax=Spirodela intermedia TaxID=51605 RepID=A0A7I8JHE4_SPIIN|nr:unnamed protein product [Spirodela intermedia]CAA6669580.1 unnamed protein product [Spirodela intermedia]
MLFGNLGNLRCGNSAAAPSRNVLDYLPMTANEKESKGKTRKAGSGGGAPPRNGGAASADDVPVLSKRLDPEALKDLGDAQYENGRFAEALALYEQAAVINPEKSLYWVNKAAANAGLGRFLEAAADCREADAGDRGVAQTRSLQSHLAKVNEARKRKDWHSVLKEAQFALSSGADSAPQVFALQAEALLKLERYEEAETALIDAPTFDRDACAKFYGSSGGAYLFMVRSLVDMASGRFDDAVNNSQRAAQLDPSNREAAAVAWRARVVSSARTKGNDLFKASKYGEACVAYGEGLGQDPQNPILLCNRAACRAKLRQWEKAIEDCSLALNVRPSYTKARLRRADCYAKLERWEESVQDYEWLGQELPGDEEVLRSLAEVHGQRKRRDEESERRNPFSDLVVVKTPDQLSDMTKSMGKSLNHLLNCLPITPIGSSVLVFNEWN